ncbi:MAG TPA: hypothetical protein VM164_07765 [Burkholderiales bacterium]|nr:hypothetical protein [Burkholderiales bacterium]
MKRDDGPEMSEQDERIAGLYRRISVEDPPPYLDARIAEAARLDPGSGVARKRREWWILWRVPFAVAAVALVSVSLVSLMMEHGGGELTLAPGDSQLRAPTVDAMPVPSQAQPEMQPQRDQPTTAQSQSQTGASGYNKTDAVAERRALARESSRARERPAASPPAVVLAPEPPPAAPPTAMRDAATISERSAVRAEIGAAAGARDLQKEQAQPMPAPAQAPAPLQSRAATAATAAPAARAFKRADSVESEAALASAVSKLIVELSGRPPAEWLERVATLRREARRPEADALLDEFRRRYPDQPIPADLLAK